MDTVKNAIDETLEDVERPFAALDFDGTCIVNDVAEATLAYLCKNGLLKNFGLLDDPGDSATYHERVFKRYYELLDKDTIGAYLFAARSLAGFTPAETEKIVGAAIDAEGEELGKTELYGVSIAHGLTARPKVHGIAQYLAEKGVKVWIVTASPEVTVRVAMCRFGYEGELVGLRNRLNENGVMTDVVEEPYSIREGKVECIKHYIDPKTPPVVAMGDSMNDAQMLGYAKLPIVVDKGNSLATFAREQGWHVITP